MSLVGKDGFQETELGRIPNEWKCVQQGNVVTFYNGRAYKLTEWEKSGTPVIRLQNLTGTSETYYYSNLCLPPHQYAKKNDLLFMWSATFGPHIWKKEKAIYHYHIWKVDCSAEVDKLYMFYSLSRFTDEIKNKTNGSTMLHLTKSGMEKELLGLPPIIEQNKISSTLNAVDDKLDVITRQIAATQTLKQGLMQTLFSRGVGTQDANGRWVPHTEFKESELGEIPKNWQTSTVGAVCDVKGGKRLPKGESLTDENTGFPYIRVTDMHMGGVNTESILYIPAHLQPSIARYTISANDIFITVAGTLGIIGMIPQELDGANLTENANKLTNISIFRDYLFYVLCSENIQEVIKRESTANAQPKLALTRIRDFEFPLPPPEEQVRIAEILKTSDTKLRILIDKNTHYQTLKRGLMQKLLTGEWRVKLDATTGEQA